MSRYEPNDYPHARAPQGDYGAGWAKLGSRAQSSSSEPHRTGAGVAPAEISVTKSRTDCDLTQQMVGGIKASSPGMKSMSADMFLDFPTMLAPSGEERTPDASAQVERAGWCCRRPDSGMHTCCGRATVMALVSSSSGPRVVGCPRARRYFGPHPVGLESQSRHSLVSQLSVIR